MSKNTFIAYGEPVLRGLARMVGALRIKFVSTKFGLGELTPEERKALLQLEHEKQTLVGKIITFINNLECINATARNGVNECARNRQAISQVVRKFYEETLKELTELKEHVRKITATLFSGYRAFLKHYQQARPEEQQNEDARVWYAKFLLRLGGFASIVFGLMVLGGPVASVVFGAGVVFAGAAVFVSNSETGKPAVETYVEDQIPGDPKLDNLQPPEADAPVLLQIKSLVRCLYTKCKAASKALPKQREAHATFSENLASFETLCTNLADKLDAVFYLQGLE